MISSNGTRGDIEDKLLFKHSLTIDSVKIVQLAQQQHIYYEVFPFEGDRISLIEDHHGWKI